MRALLQRVSSARVTVDHITVGEIGSGLVIFLGIYHTDTSEHIDILINRIIKLRIYNDATGKMNTSILETQGNILVISQFTLCADTRKGRRPSFTHAMKPTPAQKLYDLFVHTIRERSGLHVETGRFGAHMEVQIHNTGPVTFLLE